MRVFITSTPEELEPHQAAAVDMARELGLQVALRDPAGVRGLKAVPACARQVATADLVLALVGHRRGRTPAPELGGDGFHPWTWWETHAAFDRGLPVKVLMASEAWRPELRENDAKARSVMRDFRGELGRLAVLFDEDGDDGFRALVRDELLAARQEAPVSDVELRRWPPPKLPARPYPVLLPYTHPDLMAGRERELAELRQLLGRPVPILGLHAASGTGKSSLLAGGLVPGLRAEGRPVAFGRHPCEPGIARRLLGDLLVASVEIDDDEPHAFVEQLRAIRHQAKAPPVLVIDQFEDLLRRGDDARGARMAVGTLLAASVQRLPGLDEPTCRWLLAYRQEFHGQVFQWLRDVLQGARPSESESPLPHDLSSSDRFQAWALPPLGTPAAGTDDRAGAATRIFQAAIEKPLALTSEDGGPLYPWRFAAGAAHAGGAERLARAFGEARAARRTAPLAPELQVVLAHLLQHSGRGVEGTVVEVEIPEDPAGLIDRALEEHLRRSLDIAFPARKTAFPARKKAETKIADVRTRRTRALLALRELADVHGQRDEGRPVAALARAIGDDGRDVLEKLATPQTRLVLLEHSDAWQTGQTGDAGQIGDEQVYVLSHDRMAEVVVRLVDDEGAYAGLGVDAELLGLRRFVALQRELFASGEVEQSTEVPKGHFSGIERHADALLWDDEGRRWWTACRERQRRDRRRKVVRRAVAAAVVVLLTLLVGTLTDRYFKRQALLETIAEGEPEAAFEALARLSAESDVKPEELLAQVREREMPFDVLERGLGEVGEEDRGSALLRVVELLRPLYQEAPEDPVRIASTVWALDFFAAPDPALRNQAIALRDEVLAALRQSRPPPPLPELDDQEWAYIPAGTFWMGIGPGEERDEDPYEEWPRHQVTLSAFRLMTHEVTTAEYRRLVPDFRGEDDGDLPAAYINWYEAYTYAAWLGGRLPTEAEWEYAACAGCPYAYCKHDRNEATLSEVAWWPGNSVDPKAGELARQPVRKLEANPWGLFDVYGNVFEWNADWAGPYPEEPELDPPGPSSPSLGGNSRTLRGGCAMLAAEYIRTSRRAAFNVEGRLPHIGLRVALPIYMTDHPAR